MEMGNSDTLLSLWKRNDGDKGRGVKVLGGVLSEWAGGKEGEGEAVPSVFSICWLDLWPSSKAKNID